MWGRKNILKQTGFDLIKFYLDNICYWDSGKYHLRSNGLKFNIINLENDMFMLDSYQSDSIMSDCTFSIDIETPEIIENPTVYLRPFKSFDKKAKKNSNRITLEDVFSDLKSKLIEEKERGIPFQLDWH
jgi:hypothetical protein